MQHFRRVKVGRAGQSELSLLSTAILFVAARVRQVAVKARIFAPWGTVRLCWFDSAEISLHARCLREAALGFSSGLGSPAPRDHTTRSTPHSVPSDPHDPFLMPHSTSSSSDCTIGYPSVDARRKAPAGRSAIGGSVRRETTPSTSRREEIALGIIIA